MDFILGIGEYDIRLNPIETEPKIIYRFPVFKQEAAAGIGILNSSDNYDIEEYQVDNIPNNAVFRAVGQWTHLLFQTEHLFSYF